MPELNATLSFTKLTDLHVTNTVGATKGALIDCGVAPVPGRARNPGGIELPALQAARARLPNWK
jgi:hypothetical protein